MGEMRVPGDALYGASTQRAVLNFPISGQGVPAEVIHAFGELKAAAARANADLGLLDPQVAELVVQAAEEVAEGGLDAHFPVDVFQTGSGTSTNMNANEVIANRAAQLAGRPIGAKDPVHPNDHVNMGQSSNDTFPSAMHIAAAVAMKQDLRPALRALSRSLSKKARQWDKVVKIGRTHLQDAVPIRIGQEFSGYAAQMDKAVGRVDRAIETLSALPIGGTAVGTGLNAHPRFARKLCTELRRRTRMRFHEAENHFEAQAAKDDVVQVSGELKAIAAGLSKIANDIRWLGSGPRCGLGELQLPAIQPGSSIMPGKVNPVICESVVQAACQVIGNDAAITCGGAGGVGSILELNLAMPMMAHNLMSSVHLLAHSSEALREKVIEGLKVDKRRCRDLIEQSLAMATALAPAIGYDRAADIAKRAHKEGRTVREVATEEQVLPPEQLDELLDAMRMTGPSA